MFHFLPIHLFNLSIINLLTHSFYCLHFQFFLYFLLYFLAQNFLLCLSLFSDFVQLCLLLFLFCYSSSIFLVLIFFLFITMHSYLLGSCCQLTRLVFITLFFFSSSNRYLSQCLVAHSFWIKASVSLFNFTVISNQSLFAAYLWVESFLFLTRVIFISSVVHLIFATFEVTPLTLHSIYLLHSITVDLLGLYLYLVVEPMTLLFVAKTAQAYWLHAHSSQSTIAALPFQSHFSITSFLTILSIFPLSFLLLNLLLFLFPKQLLLC